MAFDPSTNYLDIWNILVYELIGDPTLVFFIGLLVIAFFAVKLQAPMQITILMCLAWMLVFASNIGDRAIWALAVLVVGGLSYYLISKMWKRG